MKSFIKLLYVPVLFNFISGIGLTQAQSDYEIVQRFKEQVNRIEQSIKDADSIEQLDDAAKSIEQLDEDFDEYKELLNRSLYPDNFYLTIEKLTDSYTLRKEDFTEVDYLRGEVTGLKGQVDTLDRRNNELISQFNLLEAQSKEDRTRVIQLEKTVAELKASLKKRDQIVMSMIDSLLPSSYRAVEDLSPLERQEIYTQAERSNVLFHIKRALDDNIRFIESTELYPKDLSEIKDQQKVFTRVWKSAGPAMVEIYSEKEKGLNELKEIDAAFTKWHEIVDLHAWNSISEKFSSRDIDIKNFSSGSEFTSAVKFFINSEMRNVSSKGDRDAIIAYKNFADKTWHRELEPEWIPFLIDYNMLGIEQKDSIEIMLASWRDSVYPGGVNWLLVVISVVIISVITVLFTRTSAKKKKKNIVSQEQVL
jgi:hypothetical protein